MIRRAKKDDARAERLARAVVGGRDDQLCVRCRRIDPIYGVNFDHRKNRSQGGLWAASNGQLLCGSGTTGCHGWKTQNPLAATQEGYSCPSWAEPGEWPARRWLATSYGTQRLTWVLYDDEGFIVPITDDEARERMGHVWTQKDRENPL